MSLAFMSMDLLWRNALGAIPLAIAVALVCRFARCRPSTRHALWLIVLLSLLSPPLAPALDLSNRLGVDRLAMQGPSASEPQPHVKQPPRALPAAVEITPPPRVQEAPAACDQPATLLQSMLSEALLSAPTPGGSCSVDAQLPVSSFATAPDRSPPMLRSSAGHPESSPQPASSSSACTEVASPNTTTDATAEKTQQTAAAPTPVTIATTAAIEWQDWLVRLLAVRESIVRLAPIPASLWLAGLVLIMLVMLARVWRFRRLLKQTVAADDDVESEVRACADSLALRHVPQVRMTDRPVSPLVWCGVRRMLVLPVGLWRELDDAGRRAVLLHELAHIRRRDHWVCWLELVACALHWWNPLVWWVRRRLRDEADYCCDAWVTAVMPASRTAYARALLATRQQLNMSRLAPPSLALGATSARSKRFARRLTMVMTNRSTPRMSLCGSAAAACLALAAWLATPLWACPPEETATPKATVKATKPDKNKVKVPHVVVAPAAAPITVAPGAVSTYEQHITGRAAQEHDAMIAQAQPRRALAATLAGGGPDGGDDRISRLEQRMDRLAAQLERLIAAQGGGQPGMQSPTSPPDVPSPPSAPSAPGAPRAARQPQPPVSAQGGPGGLAPRASAGSGMRLAAPMAEGDGETIIRFYKLPNDKAEALFEFMRRDDIPVLVASGDGGIEVHGTARQHEIFAMFIRLIHPEAEIEGMEGFAPRAAQEMEALARMEQARAAEVQGQHRQAEQHMRAARQQFERQRQQQTEQMRRNVETQRRNAERARTDLQRQMEQLGRRSEELNRKAEELREKAESLNEGDERDAMVAQADELEAQAEELESQAEAQEEELDARLEAIEAEIEAQQEALEEELTAQAEAMEAEMEAQLAALDAAKAAKTR